MQWVSEERGLGGSRELDGLTWSLKTDELWEAWVEQFVLELGPRLGAVAVPRGRSRIPLDWRSAGRSLGHLAPDLALRRANRTIWIDAKYKWHLVHLHQGDWQSSQSNWKESHRADVHQALAYASLADTETVDTVLAYPWPTDGSGSVDPPISIAHIPAGRRRVRLILAGLPFGFRGNDLERSLEAWRAVLAA